MKKISGLLILLIAACSTPPPTGEEIVNQAISASATDKLRKANASFSFRGINYQYSFDNGNYEYSRVLSDNAGNVINDILKNDGLVIYINQEETQITEERRAAYTRSVNSVIYFAFLPNWLHDPAVNKQYEGEVKIKGTPYHKVRVTFNQDGGGEDFDDVFYYWFSTNDLSMDYLAYSYSRDGGGMRFREAYNTRKINGVVIQDYKNLKPKKKGSVLINEMDKAFEEGRLEELSLIELENVEIAFQN
ncbi:MAG: DUF6503 family protein [Bacteroidota bacterium]